MAKLSATRKTLSARYLHITNLCKQVFDATTYVHGLTASGREILLAAAGLIELAKHDTPGEMATKALSKQTYAKLAPWQKHIVAEALQLCHSHFDAGSFVRQLTTMGDDGKLQVAAKVACILRLCCGIDDSNTQTTLIDNIRETPDGIEISVIGSNAASDAASGRAMSQLWNNLLCREIGVYTKPNIATIRVGPGPGAMAFIEAARVELARHVDYFTSRVPGLALTQDTGYMRELHLACQYLKTILNALGDCPGPQGLFWQGKLEWLAAAMSDISSCDAMLNFLEGVDDLATAEEEVLGRIVKSQQRLKRSSWNKLKEIMQSDKYKKFISALQRSARSEVGSIEGLHRANPRADSPVAIEAAGVLQNHLGDLSQFTRGIDTLNRDQLRELHHICQSLRQSAEIFTVAYPADTLDELITATGKIQHLLSEICDIDIWVERIASFANRQQAGKQVATASLVEILTTDLSKKKTSAIRRVSAAWRAFTKPSQLEKTRQIISKPLRLC